MVALLIAGHFVNRRSVKLIRYNAGPARDCGVFVLYIPNKTLLVQVLYSEVNNIYLSNKNY